MNYIEIKDCPPNLSATDKWLTESYPENGVYKSPDVDNELLVVDKLMITPIMWYVDGLSKFIEESELTSIEHVTNSQKVDDVAVGFAGMVDTDTMLKAIAVGLNPELAFKKE